MTEVEENPEGADNPDKEDIQPPSLKRKEGTRDFLLAKFWFLETEKRFWSMQL